MRLPTAHLYNVVEILLLLGSFDISSNGVDTGLQFPILNFFKIVFILLSFFIFSFFVSNKYCSNLTTDTKVSDVVSFLREKHNRHFKVVQIPSKFYDCVSFKVVVPFEMKDTMFDKRNWKKNVYIREFFENSRSLASLSAKY